MSEFEASAVAAPAQTDQLPTAPVRLRQAREAAGLHIAALAAALKVPVKKLEALEAGRYHELPDLTFARALASSACRHLKVDPAAVLEQIPGAVRPLLGGTTPPINAPFKSSNEASDAGLLAWLSRPVVWGAGLLLLAAIVVAVLPQGWVSRFQVATAPPPEPVITAAGSVVEAVEPVLPAAAPAPDARTGVANAETAAATDAGTAPAALVSPASEANPPAVTEALPVASGQTLLNIRAINESWIEVVNGSGVQVMQRVLKPGEGVDFSAAPPYLVVVGRADAVQVTVRGQPLDVMPYARNSVARFEVK